MYKKIKKKQKDNLEFSKDISKEELENNIRKSLKDYIDKKEERGREKEEKWLKIKEFLEEKIRNRDIEINSLKKEFNSFNNFINERIKKLEEREKGLNTKFLIAISIFLVILFSLFIYFSKKKIKKKKLRIISN